MSEENATYITGSDPQDKIRMALIASEALLRGDYQGKPDEFHQKMETLDLLHDALKEPIDIEELRDISFSKGYEQRVHEEDAKRIKGIRNGENIIALVDIEDVAKLFDGKPVTKSLFGLDLLKKVIEILEKFDVEEIEITLADDETIVFTPTDRKIGIALASRRRG